MQSAYICCSKLNAFEVHSNEICHKCEGGKKILPMFMPVFQRKSESRGEPDTVRLNTSPGDPILLSSPKMSLVTSTGSPSLSKRPLVLISLIGSHCYVLSSSRSLNSLLIMEQEASREVAWVTLWVALCWDCVLGRRVVRPCITAQVSLIPFPSFR